MYPTTLAEHCDHCFTQQIEASPERVFPLLCPMREHEWIPEWRARSVHSRSGVAEAGAVFATPAEGGEVLWVVSAYAPPRRIQFARFAADGLVTLIDIEVAASSAQRSRVDVRYRLTAASDRASATVRAFTPEHWQRMMQRWQDLMNAFLSPRPTPQP